MIIHDEVSSVISSPLPDEVECIALFGSHSRGDADSESDVDIVAFAYAAEASDLIRTKTLIGALPPNVSLSLYSTATAEKMADDGSLFLWHLKLESRTLFSRSPWFDRLKDRISVYTLRKANDDLDTFDIVLEDVKRSLASEDASLLYEASTLFSVMRSMGMIASLVSGRPTFGRTEAIAYLLSLSDGSFDVGESDVKALTSARHVYARNSGNVLRLTHDRVCYLSEQVLQASKVVRNHVEASLR